MKSAARATSRKSSRAAGCRSSRVCAWRHVASRRQLFCLPRWRLAECSRHASRSGAWTGAGLEAASAYRASPRIDCRFRGVCCMPLHEDELYQEHILDHYEEPFHRGHCPAATHAHEDDNPLCGDVVRIELAIDPDGKIREA